MNKIKAAGAQPESSRAAPPRPMVLLQPFVAATGRFVTGDDSPREFLERAIARIEAFEPQIGAFVALNLDGARQAADAAALRWRDGHPLSAIDGMPLGIKDIMETRDMPTGMGSALFTGWQSARDAAAVAALREAGAVILGKTVTTEFAATEPRSTRNPWDLDRTPGGSSSGSAAAVAAGFLPAALGTQVVGSILRPSSYCGCVGFKPTVGAINRGGSHDYLSQSCTGVIAAALEDTWHVAWNIATRAGGDPGFPGLYGPAAPPAAVKPRRVALLETPGWSRALPEAKTALQELTRHIEAAGIPLITRANDAAVEAVEQLILGTLELTRDINAWEFRWPLNTYRARDEAGLSRSSLDRLKAAEAMTLADYRDMLRRRADIRAGYAALAASCDAVLTLSTPAPAPLGLQSTGDPVFVVPASLLGVPALSLPFFTVQDLPLGAQLIGFADRDAELFAVAAWLAASWRAATPHS